MAETLATVRVRRLRADDILFRRRGNEILVQIGDQVTLLCASPGQWTRDAADLRAEAAAMRALLDVAASAAAALDARAEELEHVAAERSAS